MSWENTIRKNLRPEDYKEKDARDAMVASSYAQYMEKIIKQVPEDLKRIEGFITAFHNHTGPDDWEYDMQPSLKAFDNLKKELEKEIEEYYERLNYQGE